MSRLYSAAVAFSAALIAGPCAFAATTPCLGIVEDLPDTGSGACSGNHRTTIKLPGIGELIHNSLWSWQAVGFGNGWGFSALRVVDVQSLQAGKTGGLARLTLGDGTNVPLGQYGVASDGSSLIAPSDGRISLNQFSWLPSAGIVKEMTRDGRIYIYTCNTARSCPLTSITDLAGKVLAGFQYTSGIITRLTDAFNRSVVFTVVGGRVAVITDVNGAAYRLTYDSTGNLASIVQQDGTSWILKYDGLSHLIYMKTPNGGSESAQYNGDGSGVVTSVTDDIGQNTTFTYDASCVKLTDRLHIFKECFAQGRIQTSAEDGAVTSYTYDASGRVASIAEPGKIETYKYSDASNRAFQISDGLTTTSYCYNGLDVAYEIASSGDGKGVSCGNGQPTVPSGAKVTAYTWLNHQIATITKGGKTATFSYDAGGHLIKTTTPWGETRSLQKSDDYHYTVTDQYGHSTSYTLDSNGRLAVVRDYLGRTGLYSYTSSATGTRIEQSQPGGMRVTTNFDFLGREFGPQTAVSATTGTTLTKDVSWSVDNSGAITAANTQYSLNGQAMVIDAQQYVPSSLPVGNLQGHGLAAYGSSVALLSSNSVETAQAKPTPELDYFDYLPDLDFNDNGTEALAVYRTKPAAGSCPGNANSCDWFIGGAAPFQYGWNGQDIPVPADYTGSGKASAAVYRPKDSSWWVKDASDFQGLQFGWAGVAIPVPADYLGHGSAQVAVFQPANSAANQPTALWYIGGQTAPVTLGAPNDIPVPADYCGSGASWPAVYTPSTGLWTFAGNGGVCTVNHIVNVPGYKPDANDIPVPADYDGIGQAELAVYRPSQAAWYIDGHSAAIFFGKANVDLPVPGDYHGKGTTQIAVYRPTTSEWYIGGDANPVVFGGSTDMPLNMPLLAYRAMLHRKAGTALFQLTPRNN